MYFAPIRVFYTFGTECPLDEKYKTLFTHRYFVRFENNE